MDKPSHIPGTDNRSYVAVFLAPTSILFFAAVLTSVVRIYCRLWPKRHFGIDDYTLAFALVRISTMTFPRLSVADTL
jgi:hypothetical protein